MLQGADREIKKLCTEMPLTGQSYELWYLPWKDLSINTVTFSLIQGRMGCYLAAGCLASQVSAFLRIPLWQQITQDPHSLSVTQVMSMEKVFLDEHQWNQQTDKIWDAHCTRHGKWFTIQDWAPKQVVWTKSRKLGRLPATKVSGKGHFGAHSKGVLNLVCPGK